MVSFRSSADTLSAVQATKLAEHFCSLGGEHRLDHFARIAISVEQTGYLLAGIDQPAEQVWRPWVWADEPNRSTAHSCARTGSSAHEASRRRRGTACRRRRADHPRCARHLDRSGRAARAKPARRYWRRGVPDRSSLTVSRGKTTDPRFHGHEGWQASSRKRGRVSIALRGSGTVSRELVLVLDKLDSYSGLCAIQATLFDVLE